MKNLIAIEFFKADCSMYKGAYSHMPDGLANSIKSQGYGWDICTRQNGTDTYMFADKLENYIPVIVGNIPEGQYYKISFEHNFIVDRGNFKYPLSDIEKLFDFKIQTMPYPQDTPSVL